MPLAPDHPWFATSTERLIVMQFSRMPTKDEAQAVTASIVAFLERKPQPRPWIIEMSDVEEISASLRKIFADNEDRIAPMSKRHVTRLAYVVSKPIVRAALTAYFWIFKPPYPYRIFSDRGPAEAWVLGMGLNVDANPF